MPTTWKCAGINTLTYQYGDHLMYDPTLRRFISADSVVPGAPDGSLDGVALKPLTVDVHEPGFVTGLNTENKQGFWFQLSAQERQEVAPPWGPKQPQALNRYAYVQNNPLKYTDPTGHTVYLTEEEATQYADMMDEIASILKDMANDSSMIGDGLAYITALLAVFEPSKVVTVASAAFAATAKLGGRALDRASQSFAQVAKEIRKANKVGGSGVIIGIECGVLHCDVTVISRDTGNGSVITDSSLIFGAFGSKYRPGRACTRSGGNPASGNYWIRDTKLCTS